MPGGRGDSGRLLEGVLSLPAQEGSVEELSLEFVRVVEEAAVAAARTMGRGDRHLADQAAV